MDRRHFLALPIPLLLAPVWSEATPSVVPPGYRYAAPYWRCDALEMHLYIARDGRSYGFLTHHIRSDGQKYSGPFPGFEWDGPETDMEWVRRFYPEVLRTGGEVK